jgi:hypothetical protein
MEREERFMNTRIVAPLMLGALLLSATAALAQDDYMKKGLRSDLNPAAEFTVNGKETVTIAKLQNPVIYRICVARHGHNITILHDKDKTEIGGGRCTDVEASVIALQGNADNAESSGTYQMVHEHGFVKN